MVSSSQDLAKVKQFRYGVLVEENGFDGASVDHEAMTVGDGFDRTASHLYVLLNGAIAASMRMLPGGAATGDAEIAAHYGLDSFEAFPPKALSFTDQLVVAKAHQATKIPSLLSAAAFKLSRNSGALFDFTHTSPGLVGLYEKLGYRRYKDNFDHPELGLRVPMILVMDDLQHLVDLRSPFAAIARDFKLREKAASWFHKTFPDACAHNAKALRDETSFWEFLTNRLHENPLHGIPLFAGLNHRQAMKMLRNTSVMKLAAGDTLLRAGDMGEEMFVLLSGIMCVTADRSEVPLARFGRGAILGEVAYLSEMPRTATVKALDDSEVLVLTQNRLQLLVEEAPETAAVVLLNLSRLLCDRIRATNELVQDMS